MYGLSMLSKPLIYTPIATMIMKAMRLTVAKAISLIDSFGATHKSFAV
jgi:hypothetical protein